MIILAAATGVAYSSEVDSQSKILAQQTQAQAQSIAQARVALAHQRAESVQNQVEKATGITTAVAKDIIMPYLACKFIETDTVQLSSEEQGNVENWNKIAKHLYHSYVYASTSQRTDQARLQITIGGL